MNSLQMPASDPRQPLLVAEGGVPYRASGERDPFAAWMDLMEVVESLCPRWPPRELSVGHTFRL